APGPAHRGRQRDGAAPGRRPGRAGAPVRLRRHGPRLAGRGPPAARRGRRGPGTAVAAGRLPPHGNRSGTPSGPAMDLGIAGRTAAVAGASSGLGLASARALAAEGVRVAICSRDRERIEAAAATIEGAVPIVADVSTVEGARGFVEAAVDALGQ